VRPSRTLRSNVAIVSNTAFQFGTANFTVEGWINKPVSNTIDLIFSLGNAATPILNLYTFINGSIGTALYYPPAGNIPVSNANNVILLTHGITWPLVNQAVT
jgi:hypothetical protein